VLEAMYAAAVAGAMPDSATAAAIAELDLRQGTVVRLVAIGKAAHAMAAAAATALDRAGCAMAGGIVVAPDERPAPHPAVAVRAGDHPVPGAGSLAAAERLGEVVARVAPDDTVLVLLSGGASSLVAAPVDGVGAADLAWLYSALLGSGADIATMNVVRKRFARWSAGRLAQALAPARVHCLTVSDVLGDDPAIIGSGPCVPDPTAAADVADRLRALSLWEALPGSMREYLSRVRHGRLPETPKPGDAAFERVGTRIIVSNPQALLAAAERARGLGVARVTVEREPLTGEAAACGRRIVNGLLAWRTRLAGEMGGTTACVVWGGEPTVTLGGPADDALGGRAQELALAAAAALDAAGDAGRGIHVLAAGTDGRDGPTDAAGAVVGATTWTAIRAAGRDPARDLATHRSYAALDAAGALLRPGLTGTNVMDVVIGLVTPGGR
jgi:glycerate-2-kinase